MVDQQLAVGMIQLVALALPAFAILLQLIVESEKSYTHYAVPVITAGLGFFLVAGIVILAELVWNTTSFEVAIAMGMLSLGMVCMLVGAAAIGFQTQRKQVKSLEDADD